MLIYTLLFLAAGSLLRYLCLSDLRDEYKIVICRLDAIGYGVLFAVVDSFFLKYLFRKKYKECGFVGVIITLAAICVFLLKERIYNTYILYYPLIGIGLSLIIVFMKQVPISNTVWFNRGISAVSKISYSVYLNNLIVIYLVRRYLLVGPSVQIVISFILIGILSVLTYNFIEKRFIGLRETYFPIIKNRPATRTEKVIV